MIPGISGELLSSCHAFLYLQNNAVQMLLISKQILLYRYTVYYDINTSSYTASGQHCFIFEIGFYAFEMTCM